MFTIARPTTKCLLKSLTSYPKSQQVSAFTFQRYRFMSSGSIPLDHNDLKGNDNKSSSDYFHVLGVKRTFDLDEKELKDVYKTLMGKFHPDRHTNKPEIERDEISQKASIVTNAFQILNDSNARALHLLELSGASLDENATTQLVGTKFLMDIMEIREEIESTNESDKLEVLLKENNDQMKQTCIQLKESFIREDLEHAKKMTAILQYWKRIEETIKEKL